MTVRRRQCGLCGRAAPVDMMMFSRFSRRHFCIDDRACLKRAKRRARQEPVSAQEVTA